MNCFVQIAFLEKVKKKSSLEISYFKPSSALYSSWEGVVSTGFFSCGRVGIGRFTFLVGEAVGEEASWERVDP